MNRAHRKAVALTIEALLVFALVLVLTACGSPDDPAQPTPRQPGATVEHADTAGAAVQLAIQAFQRQYQIDGPTQVVLSRPLTSDELKDVPCVRDCASRSFYVVVLEGDFQSRFRSTDVPSVVPTGSYRFVGAIVDPTSGGAVEMFGTSDASDVRAMFSDAEVD